MSPGKGTSEFMLIIVASLITLINAVTGGNVPDHSIVAMDGLAGIYAMGRSILKAFGKG